MQLRLPSAPPGLHNTAQSGAGLTTCFVQHVQVFLGSGETLCTRVYRRVPPEAVKGAGIALVAHGGTVELSSAEAYEMRTIWSATAGL
jgi:hypothetical protein